MRGPPAARAEVVRGGDQARAEVMLPDAVDHDAGRQRVGGPGRASRPVPAGRCPVAADGTGSPPRISRNRRGTSSARVARLAALVDAGVVRLALADSVGDRIRTHLIQFVQLAFRLAQLLNESRASP